MRGGVWPNISDQIYLTKYIWSNIFDQLYLTKYMWPNISDQIYDDDGRWIWPNGYHASLPPVSLCHWLVIGTNLTNSNTRPSRRRTNMNLIWDKYKLWQLENWNCGSRQVFISFDSSHPCTAPAWLNITYFKRPQLLCWKQIWFLWSIGLKFDFLNLGIFFHIVDRDEFSLTLEETETKVSGFFSLIKNIKIISDRALCSMWSINIRVPFPIWIG